MRRSSVPTFITLASIPCWSLEKLNQVCLNGWIGGWWNVELKKWTRAKFWKIFIQAWSFAKQIGWQNGRLTKCLSTKYEVASKKSKINTNFVKKSKVARRTHNICDAIWRNESVNHYYWKKIWICSSGKTQNHWLKKNGWKASSREY